MAGRAGLNLFLRRLATGARITGPGGASVQLPPAEEAVSSTYRKYIFASPTRLLTSTHFGADPDTNQIATGKVGEDVSPEAARRHARGAGLRLLATVHRALGGDLGRVEQVVKLTGLVNGAGGFAGHGAVVDGCSEVLAEALGPERGVGVRVCSGAGSLGCSVTCDLELRVRA